MTIARRLAAVETSLTPTERVLAWLDEAHAYGTLSAYVDSLLDQAPEAFPINRLAKGAATAVRADLRRQPADVVNAAVRKALRATIFRFELVLRINVMSHEMLDREALLYTVLTSQLALLATEDRRGRRSDSAYLGRLAQCRDLSFGRVDDLLAAEEARSAAEARYLDGHAALFPDAVASWAEQVRMSQELAVMADRFGELDGVTPLVPPDPDVVAANVVARLADLVEPARSSALDKLDEGRQALSIASGWLRSKRRPEPAMTESDHSVLAAPL